MARVVQMTMSEEGAVCCDGVSYTPLSPFNPVPYIYDGKDPYFIDGLVCGLCNAVDPPKKCSRCHLVPYCNAQCQKKHWRHHKGICKAIENAKVELVEETPDGISLIGALNSQTTAHRMLSLQHNTKLALEAALKSHLILSITFIFTNPTPHPYDHHVPFLLMLLNRDNQVFLYCKYAICDFDPDEPDAVRNILGESVVSDPVAHYSDIFQDLPEDTDIQLHYLLALLILKMRLIAKYEAMKEHCMPMEKDVVEAGYETIDGVLEAQREQLNKLQAEINLKDSMVVPSLVIPELASQYVDRLGDGSGPGDLQEYHAHAKICTLRVPGARDILDW